MALGGYIKLFRQFSEWEWYKDINTKCLFIHCLISANFKDKKWQGLLIKRGQFSTSLAHLAFETGMSVRNVRTALEKLERTGEILKESTSCQTFITVCKFDSYQCLENDTDKPSTNDRQTIDKPSTNDRQQLKKDKNIEEGKEEEEEDIPQHEKDFLNSAMWELEIETLPIYLNLQLDLKEAFKFYLDYRHEKDKRGITTQTVKANLTKVKIFLKDYPSELVAKSLILAVENSNTDFNPIWVLDREKKGIESKKQLIESDKPIKFSNEDKTKGMYQHTYEVPQFDCWRLREKWFISRYQKYKPHLDSRKINVEYYKRGTEQRDHEGLVKQLETQFPHLLEIHNQTANE